MEEFIERIPGDSAVTLDPSVVSQLTLEAPAALMQTVRNVLSAAAATARCVRRAERQLPQLLPLIYFYGNHYSGMGIRLQLEGDVVTAILEVYDPSMDSGILAQLTWLLHQCGVPRERTRRRIFTEKKQVRTLSESSF